MPQTFSEHKRAQFRPGYSVEQALSLPLFKGGVIAEWRAGA